MSTDNLSIPDRLCNFFAANPNEELTLSDIETKFGCTRKTAENAVCIARGRIGLERVMIYRIKEATA